MMTWLCEGCNTLEKKSFKPCPLLVKLWPPRGLRTEFPKEKLTHAVSRRKPVSPSPCACRGRWTQGFGDPGIRGPRGTSADRGHLRSRLQCGPELVPAHPGTAGAPTPQGHGAERRLYIIGRRAARAPASRGPLPAAPPLGDEAGRRGPASARSAAPRRAGSPRRVPGPGMPRRAGERAGSPRPRPAARAPRGSARDRPRGAPVPRLTWVALWNCFLSPATDMVRGDARAAAGRRRSGAGRRRRRRRSGAGGPSRRRAGRAAALVVPPAGLWARGRGAARDAGSWGETP